MLDDVTGIILAGGRSSRFGSDKLAVDIDGRTMLQHAIDAVAVVAPRIVVVLAPDADPPPPSALDDRLSFVHDPTPFEGPLAGLAAGLDAVRTSIALVAAGDMPRMVPVVLQRLASTAGPDRHAVNLEVPRRFQPLPMAISVEAARVAVAALLRTDERSLRALLRDLGASSIPAPVWLSLDPGGATITDIDRPADLRT
ncbi:MAG: molybdenum cofactor guanylyltransferase [Chloroflexi bacterium]|nr:molybdenum cofactor guanylyltransferase [Chloroflexota bacterium]